AMRYITAQIKGETMIILGLGTNMGNRNANLDTAIGALNEYMDRICRSYIYECAALLPENAPKEWDMPFLNMALSCECDLGPKAVRTVIKDSENNKGREHRGRWAPRISDIDILACGDTVTHDDSLSVPHRELLNREFALVPLADIAPSWKYPMKGEYEGMTASQIVKSKGWPSAALLPWERAA